MRKTTIYSLLVITIIGLFGVAAEVGAWETRLEDRARASKVAVDPAGDVIAAGTFDVVKLSGATGQIIWRSKVMEPESRNPVEDMALDSRGDVFVVFAWTSVVIKVSGADGTILWRKPIGGTVNALLPIIKGVVVDREGDVITAGTMGGRFNVCKLDGGTGVEEWHYDARGGYANDVAVDGEGDVAAVGQMGNYFATVKLSGADGGELWQITQGDAHVWGLDEARAVAIDGEGDIVAAGLTISLGQYNDYTKNFAVVKYSTVEGGDGVTVNKAWEQIVDGRALYYDVLCNLHNGAHDEAFDVTVDGNGDVIASGTRTIVKGIMADPWGWCKEPEELDPNNQHFQVFRFSASGNLIAGGSIVGKVSERAQAVSVDPDGNMFAAGVHDRGFTVAKFSKAQEDGGPQWARQIGQFSDPNPTQALDVVADAHGNVVVAGETLGPDQLPRFTVIKLRPDGSDYRPLPTSPVPETVLRYAPLVYLHSDDEYRPGDPVTFINNSALLWFHEGGCMLELVAEGGTVGPERLGRQAASSAYSHHAILPRTPEDAPCLHSNVAFSAADYTRPHDGSKRSSPENNYWWDNPFYEREGFYLDLSDSQNLRRGMSPPAADRPGAPVFYEYVQHRYVTYWFFYPYNQFRVENPENGFSSRPAQEHEGDWERISIQLDEDDRPVYVNYHSHDDGAVVLWGLVDKFEGTHPIVFSAKGSHASYPAADEYQTLCGDPSVLHDEVCALDRTDYGPMWPTWRNLADVESQPWYGFGGAWGAVDALDTPLGSFFGPHFTGPLGPSPYKNSKGHWSPRISGRVTDLDGKGLAGVTVKAVDAQGQIADEAETCRERSAPACVAGSYSLDELRFGRSYTVVASMDGYSFTPVVRVFVNLRGKQTADFRVLDTTPPVLRLPPDISVDARVPEGATVYYTVTAADNVTADPRISCRPSPGVIFPIGVTTVSCTAVDEAGNSAAGDFRVTVRGAAEQLASLTALIQELDLHHGTKASLLSQLQAVMAAHAQGRATVACNALKAFQSYVRAQSGKHIPAARAAQLTASANQISLVIGCR